MAASARSLAAAIVSPPPGIASALGSRRHAAKNSACSASVGAIARSLHLWTHAVKNQVRRAMAHLGVHSRLEAVLVAARHGLVDLSSADDLDIAAS